MKPITSLLFLVIAISLASCSQQKSPIVLKKEILSESQKLDDNMQALKQVVLQKHSQKQITEQYQKTKLDYQNMEWALEYFLPEILDQENTSTSRKAGDSFFPQKDFTTLDALILSAGEPQNQTALLQQIDSLIEQNRTITAYVGSIDMGETALTAQ